MNIVHKAILHACWQEENEHGRHAARPWLRWFLTRVVGIVVIPSRKSERIQMAKEEWLAARKEAALRIDPETAEVFWEHGQTLDPSLAALHMATFALADGGPSFKPRRTASRRRRARRQTAASCGPVPMAWATSAKVAAGRCICPIAIAG